MAGFTTVMPTWPPRWPPFRSEVVGVNTDPLLRCIQRGVTPVISPVALGEDGRIYNCNADVAAAMAAIPIGSGGREHRSAAPMHPARRHACHQPGRLGGGWQDLQL